VKTFATSAAGGMLKGARAPNGRGKAALPGLCLHYSRSISTRLSWKTAPPPMSASRSSTVALTVAPSLDSLGQRPLVLATTPGRTRGVTSTRATNAPRS